MSLTIPRKSLSSLKEMSLAKPIFGKFWEKRHQGIHVFLTSQSLGGPLVPRIAWAGKNPIDLVDSEAIRGGSGHHVCLETTRQLRPRQSQRPPPGKPRSLWYTPPSPPQGEPCRKCHQSPPFHQAHPVTDEKSTKIPGRHIHRTERWQIMFSKYLLIPECISRSLVFYLLCISIKKILF